MKPGFQVERRKVPLVEAARKPTLCRGESLAEHLTRPLRRFLGQDLFGFELCDSRRVGLENLNENLFIVFPQACGRPAIGNGRGFELDRASRLGVSAGFGVKGVSPEVAMGKLWVMVQITGVPHGRSDDP